MRNLSLLITFIIVCVAHIQVAQYAFERKSSEADSVTRIKFIKIRDIGRKNGASKVDTIALKDLGQSFNYQTLTRKSLKQVRRNDINNEKTLSSTSLKNKGMTRVETQQYSDFNLNTSFTIQRKKGIPVDELNPEELVYYSFKNRFSQQYSNALRKHFDSIERKYPFLIDQLRNSNHQMAGRVIYDKKGNIVKIKILDWSKSSELQNTFVSALQELEKISNLPKELITDDGFAAVFKLNVTL